jgi:aldehyde:ferredoxin oxidoreductase
MPQLLDHHIQKFKEIYKAKFGVELTNDQAREKGDKLYRLMRLIYKPMTKDEFEKVSARMEELAGKKMAEDTKS